MPKKVEIGATCGIIALVVFLLLGLYYEVLSLDSVLSNASWFIFAGMVGLFLWGFRERIDTWFYKILPPSTASTTVDSNISIKPTQEWDSEESTPQTEGLKQYKSRSELPPFKEMLSKANVTVDMSGLDFTIIVLQYMSNIRVLLYEDIRVTLLLLDPDSEQVDIQSKIYHGVQDLKESIKNSIKLLCDEKEKLPPNKRGNLIIRLYDYEPKHGLIITDEGHDNAWIKVEARPIGSDSNSRPSDAWYNSYDPHRYSQFIHEYDTLLNNSKEYRCPTS